MVVVGGSGWFPEVWWSIREQSQKFLPLGRMNYDLNLLENPVKKLSREDKFLKAVRSSSRLILVIP